MTHDEDDRTGGLIVSLHIEQRVVQVAPRTGAKPTIAGLSRPVAGLVIGRHGALFAMARNSDQESVE